MNTIERGRKKCAYKQSNCLVVIYWHKYQNMQMVKYKLSVLPFLCCCCNLPLSLGFLALIYAIFTVFFLQNLRCQSKFIVIAIERQAMFVYVVYYECNHKIYRKNHSSYLFYIMHFWNLTVCLLFQLISGSCLPSESNSIQLIIHFRAD